MGGCLSKKSACASSSPPVALPKPPEKLKSEILPEKKKAEEETVVKKEIFIIKHRRSHEVERQKSDDEKGKSEFVEKGKNPSSSNGVDSGGGGGGAAVRTSSCTKEEVDAILIQCGRLSRSSSTGKAALSSEKGGRKYSGSKRSYDFDHENGKSDVVDGDDDAVARERENRRRERRQSQGRRRTPSREREKDQAAQQRSGSRERGGSGGSRRVSRSPGRRSESPITGSGTNSNSSAANANSRPGKMVSVPATVSGGAEPATTAVKRIQVKRNVGGDAAVGTRTAASPRARSPARARASNETSTQQPVSLSRSNSRKAEISPFRRNPLGEIDTNIISQKPNAENKMVQQGSENRINSSKNQNQEQQHVIGMNVICAGPETTLKTNAAALTRSRSSRLSRDLDISPEALTNPNSSSYTALLLEDIQNFHQKNTPAPSFTLPPCVSKACSILEAVADLNSSVGSTTLRKTKADSKDPIMESEVVVSDDLMQPSFHTYVTVRRGTSEDLEEQESSGSNSFVSSQQQWGSSSSWEPNSAESTDRWTTSSRSVSTTNDGGGKKVIASKKREFDHQDNGIGRGRVSSR